MSEENKQNEQDAAANSDSAAKKKEKKVWIPGKDGSFKAVMREVPDPPAEPEEAPAEEERQRKQFKSDKSPRKKQPQLTQERKQEAPEKPDITIPALYTIGMVRSNPQKMLEALADTDISILIDLRGEGAMHAPGFVKPRDLAILLKETTGIEYRRETLLVPGRDLALRYEQDGNWVRFRQGYLHQLSRSRVEQTLNAAAFARQKTILLGQGKDPARDIRGLLAEYLSAAWNILNVHHL